MTRLHLLTTLLVLALPLSPALAAAETPARTSAFDLGARHPASDPAADVRTGWLRYLRIRKGAGFEARRPVEVGEHRVILGVKGPIMKRKRLGLTFEVRF